jgi:YVTN family beta-propeller protein
VRHDPARVYVPNSQSNTVDVISQRTRRVVDRFAVGALPQHVTPSWDLRTLWVTNDLGNSLTPIDPRTGRHGRAVPVRDPYNLYFTADGRRAIVVAKRTARWTSAHRTPCGCATRLRVPQCSGIDHMDFTAGGRRALVSCEFAGRMVVVDLRRQRVTRTIVLRAGAMPQDVKLAPDGRTFYVADMALGGVWLIDARTWARLRFERTGRGAHGLYPSRDSRSLYVSNRDAGSITVISFPHPPAGRDVAPARACVPGHGRRLRGRPRAVAQRPLRRRGVRDLDPDREAPTAHPRRSRAARPLRLAAARTLLDRAHRDPALRRKRHRRSGAGLARRAPAASAATSGLGRAGAPPGAGTPPVAAARDATLRATETSAPALSAAPAAGSSRRWRSLSSSAASPART